MKLTIDIGEILDLTPRVVGVVLNMGEGEVGTNMEVTVLDLDWAVRKKLTERTKKIKGIVGVPPAVVTAPVTTPAVGASPGTATVSVGSTGSMPGNWRPAGFKLTPKGIPSYPTPGTVKERQYGIIAECLRQGVKDLGQIAYILATVRRECGEAYAPIEENLNYPEGPPYYVPWHGRGLIQVTFQANYQKVKDLTGADTIGDPGILIRDFGLSAFALVYGMKHGIYTGRKIGDYVSGSKRDFYNARRVVNALDHASLIAGTAETWLAQLPAFMAGLNGAQPSAAAAPVTPTVAAPTTPTPSPTAAPTTTAPTTDYPEGDKIFFSDGQSSWEVTYTGYSAGTNGTITLVGQGVRGTADTNVTAPNKQYGVKNISVVDYSDIVAKAAKAVLEIDLEGEYRETLLSTGGLTPSQMLAKLAGLAGLTVTDTGAKLLIREKFKVQTHTLEKVVGWGVGDKAVSQLTVISGNSVKAFPTTITIPLSRNILAGDNIIFKVVYSEPLTVERVSHNFMAGTTTLDCYVDFEANEKLIVKSATPVVATATGSAVAGAVAANPTGASAAVLDPSGAVTSQGIPRVKVTSTFTEAMYYSGQRNKGRSTRDGPDGGNQACAFSVNKFVIEPVFGRVFGNAPGLLTFDGFGQPPTYTSSMLVTGVQAESRKIWGGTSVPVKQAIRGCISILLNSVAGHVGMTIEPIEGNDVNSLSNSSSRASFDAVYFWQASVRYRYPDMRFDYINMNSAKRA